MTSLDLNSRPPFWKLFTNLVRLLPGISIKSKVKSAESKVRKINRNDSKD
jgi:hypothetical protein